MRRIVLALFAAAVISGVVYTQGRSAPDWTTQGGDAQRSSWIAVDPWLSLDSMADFKFLWKIKLDNEARQMNALSAPVSMANINTFRGFKSLIFVGGSSNNVYAVDYDFGTLFWKTHFNYAAGAPESGGSPTCPGGMTAAVTRPTNLIAPSQLSFMGFARAPRPAKAEVGEPGKGAPQLTPERANGGRGRGAGAAGRGRGTPPPPPGGGPVAAPPAAPPPGGGRGPNVIVAVAGDGLVRALNPISGETVAPAAKMLPPNSSASGLIHADGLAYAVTQNGCGSAPDGVWAMDWSSAEKPVVSWKSNGAPVAGPAFGTDGMVYVTTGDGTSAYANSVVALDAKTLQLKDWFTMPPGAPAPASRVQSPVLFSDGSRSYVAAAGLDGHVYLLDSAALGGTDHKTPLLAGSGKPGIGELSTWRDGHGTRWILAVAHTTAESGAIVAYRMTQGNGAPALEQAWVSRDLVSPQAAMIVNGVAFALSGGTRSQPAVLYALNPETGKEIWNSGNTITSFATGGLSAGTAQVYVVTYDNTVWAFGIPQAY